MGEAAGRIVHACREGNLKESKEAQRRCEWSVNEAKGMQDGIDEAHGRLVGGSLEAQAGPEQNFGPEAPTMLGQRDPLLPTTKMGL